MYEPGIRSRKEQACTDDGPIYAYVESVTAWLGHATTLSGVLIGGLSKVDDRTAVHGDTYLEEEMQEGQPVYESMVFSLRASVTFKHPLEVG